MKPYERFECWGHCHRLVLSTYRLTKSWPREEIYGLTAQVRRAVVSAGTNLVEGSAKRGPKEFARYLDIANGSLAEVGYLLRIAKDLGYLSSDDSDLIEGERDEAAKSVWGLYQSVRRNPSG